MNRERLEHAYAIIDGIPEDRIDLHAWTQREGESLGCGTICCAAGWLARHPDNIRAGFSMRPCQFAGDKTPTFAGSTGYEAIMKFYGLTQTQAFALFGTRYMPPHKAELSDKQLWLLRIRNFLERNT